MKSDAEAGLDVQGRPAMISDKVHSHHLARKALLYVRQSSAHQVLHTLRNEGGHHVQKRIGSP
jgi:hypothetical protein